LHFLLVALATWRLVMVAIVAPVAHDIYVADDDAVRSRRYRAHKQGNHVYCKRDCQAARDPVRFDGVPDDPGESLNRFAELRRLCVALRTAYLADPANAALAKEWRMTLLCLPGSKDMSADDELSQLMRELARPVQTDPRPGWPGQSGDGSHLRWRDGPG
jgi:hypothetical protein